MTRPSFLFLGSGAAAAALTAAATAGGLDRFWQPEHSPSGDFNDPFNWLDGADLGVPGASDTAIFDLPVLYTVGFPEAQATDRVVIRAGAVTFDLTTPYALLNPLPITPAIVIGETGSDTARLTITGGSLTGDFTRVGLGEGAFGWLIVSGAAASLANDSTLSVGEQGAGILEIVGGAEVSNGPASIAAGFGSFGDAIVAGPASIWSCGGTLVVGKNGAGGMTIEDGGLVSSGNAIIAQNESTFGDVLVRGKGSSWLIDGSLDVGMTSLGMLTIEDGGSVTTTGFATMGTFPVDFPFGEVGGIGEVRVTGPGSVLDVQGTLYVSYLSVGRLTVGQGGRVFVGGDMTEWFGQAETVIELGSSSDYVQPAIEVAGLGGSEDARIELVGGFVPAQGDLFEILTTSGGAASMTFDLPALPPPLVWLELLDSTSARLRVGPIVGDLDGDGFTGITDLLDMLAAWGPCKGCPADLDGDGDVGISDLLLLLDNWD